MSKGAKPKVSAEVPSAHGGKRPGAGRPRGSKNAPRPTASSLAKMSRREAREKFKELLEPVERAAAVRLTQILLKETKDRPDLALEACRLVFEFRQGKPAPMEWLDEMPEGLVSGQQQPQIGQQANIGVLMIGGNEEEYKEGLRMLRMKMRGTAEPQQVDLSKIPPPLPAPVQSDVVDVTPEEESEATGTDGD